MLQDLALFSARIKALDRTDRTDRTDMTDKTLSFSEKYKKLQVNLQALLHSKLIDLKIVVLYLAKSFYTGRTTTSFR